MGTIRTESFPLLFFALSPAAFVPECIASKPSRAPVKEFKQEPELEINVGTTKGQLFSPAELQNPVTHTLRFICRDNFRIRLFPFFIIVFPHSKHLRLILVISSE